MLFTCHFGRPLLDYFRFLGHWCFGCFNLRRDGQCNSNVDLVLLSPTTLFALYYPCLQLRYKVSAYPIPSTPDPSCVEPCIIYLQQVVYSPRKKVQIIHNKRQTISTFGPTYTIVRNDNFAAGLLDIYYLDTPLISCGRESIPNRPLDPTDKQF